MTIVLAVLVILCFVCTNLGKITSALMFKGIMNFIGTFGIILYAIALYYWRATAT